MDDDILARLTENGQYANELCLMFYVMDESYFLEYFDKIDIRGKDLETFAYKCCHEGDIDYIRDTLLCISFGLFDIDKVYENLKSSNPVNFIDERELSTDTHIQRFVRLKREFDQKFNKNKGR